MVAAALVISSSAVAAQPRKSAEDLLLDALVYGATAEEIRDIEAQRYPQDLRPRIENYKVRFAQFQSRLPRPRTRSAELEMVWLARVNYERKLFSIARGAGAAEEAASFVMALEPCYEWEGDHGCPEKEAVFARTYLREHPGSALRDYLPLLEAHRWQCVSDAYLYEKKPADAAQTRPEYLEAVERATRVADPLVRFAAHRLSARASCLAPGLSPNSQ